MKYIILLNDYEPFETDDPIDELVKNFQRRLFHYICRKPDQS